MLSDLQKQILEKLSNAAHSPKSIAIRAKIVLLHTNGIKPAGILNELNISFPTIYKWIARWTQAKTSLDLVEKENSESKTLKSILKNAITVILKDAFRSGAPAKFTPEQVIKILELACREPKTEGVPVTHWSCTLLAKHAQESGIVKKISRSKICDFLKSRDVKTS
jgi:transposase